MTLQRSMDERSRVGIYVHVPFCLSKCYYCDFCSILRADAEKKQAYVERVCREIELFSRKIGERGAVPVADTVYFGGGTPTLLTDRQLGSVLETIASCFGITADAEITVETNPKTAGEDKLADIRKAGVNRLSIGMQSVHDSELRLLGRIHGYGDFLETYEAARSVGFDNISVDLMYGIPSQTRETFRQSVKGLAMLAPEHISSYSLTVEEGTNFYRRRDSLNLPDEDTVSDMYADMEEVLAGYGYHKYEISNFARAGRESRHNLKYWRREDYLGFGSAAHSCFDNFRFAHSSDVDAYIDGRSTIIDLEKIGMREAMDEYAMLGMRLSSGVAFADFYARFGLRFQDVFPRFAGFSPEYVEIDAEGCRFTPRGMFVSNAILSDVLNLENYGE